MSDKNVEVEVTTAGVFAAGRKLSAAAAATAIVNISETEAVFSAAERVKFNLILAALRSAGTVAS